MTIEDLLNQAYTNKESVAETVEEQLAIFKNNLNQIVML